MIMYFNIILSYTFLFFIFFILDLPSKSWRMFFKFLTLCLSNVIYGRRIRFNLVTLLGVNGE